MSRSPSLLLQRLALSISTVVPELRRLEYQWVGLANLKKLYFTEARLTQTLRICCHHELRVSRNQPEAEKFSSTFVKILKLPIHVVEFSKQRNDMQEKDPLHAGRSAICSPSSGGWQKSLCSCFLFVLYALTYNCVTLSSSYVYFTILTSKTVLEILCARVQRQKVHGSRLCCTRSGLPAALIIRGFC